MKRSTRLPAPKDGMQPFEYAMSLVSGKWKLPILFAIGARGTIRYGELRRAVSGITDKVLSEQLRQLEETGIVIRTEYPDEAVSRVEYSLSVVGMDFMPALMEICRWGKRCGWENMTPERGWKNVATVWGSLLPGDDVHFPNAVCRRVHSEPLDSSSSRP